MGCPIDDDALGDRAQRALTVEPIAQLNAMRLGERRRSTGGERHPPRVWRHRQLAIELCCKREGPVEYPGLSLFAVLRPEAAALEVAEKRRHLGVLRKQRRRLRIGDVSFRRGSHTAAADLQVALTLHRNAKAEPHVIFRKARLRRQHVGLHHVEPPGVELRM